MRLKPDQGQFAIDHATERGYEVRQQKLFHHQNLVLQLLWDPRTRCYVINVHRLNDRSDHDMWGLWLDDQYEQALAKYQGIVL